MRRGEEQRVREKRDAKEKRESGRERERDGERERERGRGGERERERGEEGRSDDSPALWRWRARCSRPLALASTLLLPFGADEHVAPALFWRGREAKPDRGNLGYPIGPWRAKRRREKEREDRTEKRETERRSEESDERRDAKEGSHHIEFDAVHCAWGVFLDDLSQSNSNHIQKMELDVVQCVWDFVFLFEKLSFE